MIMSTANLTMGQVEKWRAKGYIVEVDADNESVNVYKPQQGDPKADQLPTYS